MHAGFEDPPDFADETDQFVAWLTSPVGVVTRLRPGARLTLPIAHYLVGTVEPAIEQLRRHTGTPKALYLHDWGAGAGHDTLARQALIDWGIGLGREKVGAIFMVSGETLPRMSRMAMEVASVSLSLVGIPTRVLPSFEEAVRAAGVRPATSTTATPAPAASSAPPPRARSRPA